MLGLTHGLLGMAWLAPPPQGLIADRESFPRVLLSLRWGELRGCGGIASISRRKEKKDLMASESPRRRLREEVTCPICLEYFLDPVTLACEHNFCCFCILQSWAKSPTSTLCPLCKRPFHTDDLKPNYNLASFAQLIKLLNEQEEVEGRDVCERHQEPLKLFCKDNEVLICTLCEKEHQGHNIILVEEAAQQYKDRISASLEALKKQKKEMMVTISSVQEETEVLLKQMETERQKTEVMFQDLWPFLKKQEDCTLARMKCTRKEMEKKRDQHMDQLNQELSSLEHLIQETEEKRVLPASQFLQDVGSILGRSKQKMKLKNPSGFLPELKQKASAFTDSSANLDRAIKEFEDSVPSCY